MDKFTSAYFTAILLPCRIHCNILPEGYAYESKIKNYLADENKQLSHFLNYLCADDSDVDDGGDCKSDFSQENLNNNIQVTLDRINNYQYGKQDIGLILVLCASSSLKDNAENGMIIKTTDDASPNKKLTITIPRLNFTVRGKLSQFRGCNTYELVNYNKYLFE